MTRLPGPVLVVGAGSIGMRHLRNLRTLGVTDLAVADPRAERRDRAAKELGARPFAEVEDALAMGPVVAVICSPSNAHVAHALAAVRVGCHLFIEKPLADRPDGLNTLEDEVAARDAVTLVACNFRFHPGLARIRMLVGDGVLGRLVSARARFGQYLPDWHPWEDYREGYSARRMLGGGVLLDRIHELDYVVWLLGRPAGVFALLGHLSRLEIDTEDVVDLLLRYPGGPFVSIHLDYVRRTYDCGLELIGDEGTATWTVQDNVVRWYLAADGKWHEETWPAYDMNTMYLEEMRHFFNAIEGREPSVCPVSEGRAVLDVALAARRSAESRCEEAV